MPAQWPVVKAWLVTTIPTLPGLSDVIAYAGPQVSSENPPRYATIGYVDDDSGGQYQQLQADDGSVWQEIGEVRSKLVAQAGESDPSITEAAVFAIADALEVKIRSDRTLGGILSADGTSESAFEVHSVSNANGTATALVHVLRYSTIT